jgi:ABC-type Fe3+/spermidine/putrescine transport system ATPase subunit
VGATNLLPGRLVAISGQEGEVEVLAGRTIRGALPQPLAWQAQVSVSIRPESIRLAPRQGAAPAGENRLEGRIAGVTFLGASHRIDVVTDGVTLQVAVPSDQPLPADPEVWVIFAPDRAVVLAGEP